MKYCEACSTYHSDESNYCYRCGTGLADASVRCPCGYDPCTVDKFCPKCGREIQWGKK